MSLPNSLFSIPGVQPSRVHGPPHPTPPPRQLEFCFLNRVLASYHGMRTRLVNVLLDINIFRPPRVRYHALLVYCRHSPCSFNVPPAAPGPLARGGCYTVGEQANMLVTLRRSIPPPLHPKQANFLFL